jgi:hypothetical protein
MNYLFSITMYLEFQNQGIEFLWEMEVVLHWDCHYMQTNACSYTKSGSNTSLIQTYINANIGYCRFVLYSGIPGLVIFSLFFIYNAVACMRKLGPYKDFCIGILILGFIIWVKVATDLFIIYALLYCIYQEKEEYV